MEFALALSKIVTIGVYGAMLATVMFAVEIAKSHSNRRKEAEAARDVALAKAEAARAEAAIALSHRDKAEATLAIVEADRADARAKVEKLFSSGSDLAQQVAWRREKIMGSSEYRIYQELLTLVKGANTRHLLFSQVACGAFLKPAPTPAKPSIAAEAGHVLHRKFVDFLLVDWRGFPVAVIEYQGAGHYQGSAYDRDQAKRIACHRAGIAFIEIPEEGLAPTQSAAILQAMGQAHRVAAE